ncbi:chitinase [Streptomyces coffeae]|uniref:Chitinase n=1 Tax=Streptomyces coffeae TaxID=621382 RepID=A0ABS1NGE5_9ACTN|nr:chitinase [Streptomyces coffeae]MBL1099128.1 chitinase [Streptomyces coffeae]
MRASPRMSGIAVAAAVVCAGIAVWAGQHEPSPEPRARVVPTSARSPQPAPPPPADFVPYVSAWSESGYDMAAAAGRGVKEFTLGFVVAGDGCAPVWDGGTTLDDQALDARIEAVRRAGGDVRVSFGGADGTELSTACTDVSELAAAYTQVIERYRLTKADFDVEGDSLADTAAAVRRAQAIALLQRTHEGLDVSFTLPAMPDGLTAESTAQLEAAKDEDVALSAVNIMAMNYGDELTGDMGDYAIRAATAAQARVRGVLGLSDDAAWKTLGVTPMIGLNNVSGEVFTLEDAAGLTRFAAEKGIGRLSMWSAERDRPCDDAADEASGEDGAAAPGESPGATPENRCSGIAQRPGAFEAVLRG